jgi:hypothetical protein
MIGTSVTMSRVSSEDDDAATDGVGVRDTYDLPSGSLDAEGPRGPTLDRGVSVTKIFAGVKPREPGLLLAHRSGPSGFSGHEPLHAGNFRRAHVPVLAFPHPDDREGSPDGREVEVAKK